jgi:hypothetical protein
VEMHHNVIWIKGKGKVAVTEHHANECVLGSGGIAPSIHDLGTRRR